MSLAKFRKQYGSSGTGRFVVSEGIAPSAALTAHPGLPTLWYDEENQFNEIVMPKGCILSVVPDSNGDARVVPANGTASGFVWDDTSVFNVNTGATPASDSGVAQVDTVTVGAKSLPIGCAQFNVLRPFDKGTDIFASWITTGYVEWPMVAGLNTDVVVGGAVRADAYGRPVKHTVGTDDYLMVGKVIEVEKFATNFDDGLLSYMQLPSDPGALKKVYELTRPGTYQGKLGIRKNLDVVNSVGAIRVVLTLA